MRLVHLADLHLGFRQYHRLTANGTNQREADVELAFRRAVDRAIDLRPDLVVIAGDVFHAVRPANAAIIHAFLQFQRLRTALPEAEIVMIAGNHDRPRATEMGCILNLFRPLGIHVAAEKVERFRFPERGLSVLAVSDSLARTTELLPEPGFRYNVLALHGELPGIVPEHLSRVDRAVQEIPLEALHAEQWGYVALGHYHVCREIAPNAYYAGSLEYTSANPWGELVEEREAGLAGKGFIEYDLDARAMRFHPLEAARALVNLPAVTAKGMSAAELDAAIRERVEGWPGGIDDRIVRLIVRDVPRHVVRELDQKALREYKRRAMHFHLDPRAPEQARLSAAGAPGRRATLPETVEHYLAKRPLEAGTDRAALVALGLQYLREADEASQAAGAAPAAEGSAG